MSVQTTSTPAPASDAPPALTTVLLQVAGAIGTGIGVLGFVIFVGGALIWTRFDVVGVPAADAVAIIPKEVLLTTGASVLAPIALLGLAVVAVLYGADSLTELSASSERAELVAEVKASHEACVRAQAAFAEANHRAQAALPAGTAASTEQMEQALQRSREADAQRQAYDTAEQNLQELRASQAKRRHKQTVRRSRIFFFILFAVITVATLMTLHHLHTDGKLVVLVVAAMSSAVALALYARTRKFLAFALAAFLAATLTFAVGRYYDARNNPLLVPAAAVSSDRGPIAGFLIAQTADRVYIGVLEGARSSHVVALDRKKVTDFAVDGAVNTDHVMADAKTLAAGLCQRYGRDAKTRDAKTGKDVLSWPTGKDQICSKQESGRL